MSLILSHETALDVYRSSLMPCPEAKGASIKAIPVPTSEDSAAFRMLPVRFASKTFHCVVPEAKDRREIKQGICHVLGEDVRALFVRRMGKDSLLYVVPPEVLFLQMAATLSLIDLVKLGYELCGKYSMVTAQGSTSGGVRKYQQRPAVTDSAKLKAYVYDAGHSRSVKRARMAVRYIVDGSASPRETELCMLLVIPRRLGGYGFDKPLISHGSDAPSTVLCGDLRVESCSLLWGKAQMAVEYHAAKWAKSKNRGDGGQSAYCKACGPFGFSVVGITDWHIEHAANLDEVAKAVALGHGRSFRKDVRYDFPARQNELRKQVLGRG